MTPFELAKNDRDKAFRDTLSNMDKWMHCAILLGILAIENGIDREIIHKLWLADKAEIDKLLLEKIKEADEREKFYELL